MSQRLYALKKMVYTTHSCPPRRVFVGPESQCSQDRPRSINLWVTRPWHGVHALALGNEWVAPKQSSRPMGLKACASMKGGNGLRLNAGLK